MTAHLKDQLQEVKVKTNLEKKYVKNRTELLTYQGQKLNTQTEKQLEDDKRVHVLSVDCHFSYKTLLLI